MQSSAGFTVNGPEIRKYPVSSCSEEKSGLFVCQQGSEWADSQATRFQKYILTGYWQHLQFIAARTGTDMQMYIYHNFVGAERG